MLDLSTFDGNWIASNALELFSLLIASLALLYAARAFHVTKRTWKATLNSKTSELRLLVKTAVTDAHRSLEILDGRCHDMQSQWDAHNRKNHFLTIGSSFNIDPEMADNSRVQQHGRRMLLSLKDSFSNLDDFSNSELEQRLLDAKHVAIQIESLARQLQGPPAPFR